MTINYKLLSGASVSLALLLGLSGCSSTSPEPAAWKNQKFITPSSFSSSPVCAKNAFLQKYQCSFTRIEEAARSGDPDAQYALGYLYYYGIGVTQDRETGLTWIRKSAAQGQRVATEALHNLSASNATVKPVTQPPTPTSLAPATAPERPLTDYLPNYGEKRVDTTAASPPAVDLSTPPSTPNQ